MIAEPASGLSKENSFTLFSIGRAAIIFGATLPLYF